MIEVNILDDEELQIIVKKFISSLLPHKSFNSTYFVQALSVITQYIKVEEFSMEYRAVISAIHQMSKISILRKDYRPRLVRESFDGKLQVSIQDMVIDPTYRVVEYLQKQRQQYNMDIPSVKEAACSILYTRALELYDECFAMEMDTETIFDYQLALQSAFEVHAINKSLNQQAMLLEGSIRIGRQVFSGTKDWYKYCSLISKEIENRILGKDESMSFAVDTLEKEKRVEEQVEKALMPICEWGIPQLDDGTPLMCHRMTTIVANENVGKTKLMTGVIPNVIDSNSASLVVSGENNPDLIWVSIMISYMYKKFKYKLRPLEVVNPDKYLTPDAARKIKIAKAELRKSNLLRIRNKLTYGMTYDQLVAEYDLSPFSVLFIDHSLSQDGSVGGNKENVDKLSEELLRFKNEYPVQVVILSHLSANAKDDLSKGVPFRGAPTRESQALSTDSDEVYVLYKNEALTKLGLIGMITHKRRHSIPDKIFLRTIFDANTWTYDEKDQKSSNSAGASAAEAINMLENMDYDIEIG